jgi:hypothetical protein
VGGGDRFRDRKPQAETGVVRPGRPVEAASLERLRSGFYLGSEEIEVVVMEATSDYVRCEGT